MSRAIHTMGENQFSVFRGRRIGFSMSAIVLVISLLLYYICIADVIMRIHMFTCALHIASYIYYSAHSLKSFSVADYIKYLSYLLSLTTYIHRLILLEIYFPKLINPNPPCQLILWVETEEPLEKLENWSENRYIYLRTKTQANQVYFCGWWIWLLIIDKSTCNFILCRATPTKYHYSQIWCKLNTWLIIV